MKTYVTDILFESFPSPDALREATATAFDVPVDAVAVEWFLADEAQAAYQDRDMAIVWLRNHDQGGEFPAEYGLALEGGDTDQEVYAANLARVTGSLGVAAVMPQEFGKLRLFGPDGSDRIVDWAADDGEDDIRLTASDRNILERARRATHAIASQSGT